MSSDFTRSQHQLINEMIRHARRHEKFILHPYLDTKDNITIGAGYNVTGHGGEDRFEKMPWRIKVGTRLRPPVDDEISEAFDKLDAMKNENRRAESFENITPLRIDPDYAAELTREKAEESVGRLYREFGTETLEKLTLNQRIVLADIIYNKGSLNKFDELSDGIRTNNVNRMAENIFLYTKMNDDETVERNWERLIHNYMLMKGISRQQAIKEIAILFKDKMKREATKPPADLLNEINKLNKGKKTSDNGSSCQSPVYVRAYTRDGIRVSAYQRDCPTNA